MLAATNEQVGRDGRGRRACFGPCPPHPEEMRGTQSLINQVAQCIAMDEEAVLLYQVQYSTAH